MIRAPPGISLIQNTTKHLPFLLSFHKNNSLRKITKQRIKMSRNQTLIAFDGSGSTGNDEFYHDETQRIVSQYADNSTILYWDHASKLITHTELAEINKKRNGGGGTDPAVIADYIKKHYFDGNLVIITDGEVYGSIVQNVSARLPSNATFTSVTAYLISVGRGQVNMSVTCPFTRRSPHQVFLYDTNHECNLVNAVTKEEQDTIHRVDDINTLEKFEASFNSLEKAVISLTMGTTGDSSLRDSLLAMKSRLVKSIAKTAGESDFVKQLETALDCNRTIEAIQHAKSMTAEYYGLFEKEDPDAKTWSAKIARLVSMTEGALSSTFDLSGISSAIRGDRARRAIVATPVPMQETPITTEDEAVAVSIEPFECPITVDNETDVVLLIKAGKPILSGVDKNIANDLYDCPLNLFNYPELVSLLKDRIDHAISLQALKDSYDSGSPITVSPMTRTPITKGAICLGANEIHCKATSWTLANLFTGGKLVGNQDLWYACIWLVVDSDDGIEYLQSIVPQLREHMKWRLLNHKTSVSLTGLPEFPVTKVSLRTAVWYTFASAEIAMPPNRDVLRMHLAHIQPLKKLVVLCGLEINEGVSRHIVRLQVMLSMLRKVKENHHLFRCLILALTQNCVEVDTSPTALRVTFERTIPFVPIDGNASEAQVEKVLSLLPKHYKQLSVQELVSIAKLVDPSKSAGAIELSMDWNPLPLESDIVRWDLYKLKDFGKCPVNICHDTCRPYYQIGNETWKMAATRFYGGDHLLSVHEYFIKFVQRYKMYPNADELVTYLYNKKIVHGWYSTLPYQTLLFVTSTIEDCSDITATISVQEFIRRSKASQPIEARCLIEKGNSSAIVSPLKSEMR